ncbi:hypothetical protein V1517DRAFT_305082 [Lipomyces orientalis]|uniref:Uncharacterized protein n=1 Tax=Lipomyces orientalis TaxID=1233043 RepID=A0ACC3TWT4_9ASCO
MVPDSVDERILEEHLLRDRFYNLDYTSMSSSATSRSVSSSLHAKLGYVYDFFLVMLILLVAGAALYVVLRALVLVRRKNQADSHLLPLSSTPTVPGSGSVPSSGAPSPSLPSSSSSFFGNGGSHKEKNVGKQGGTFDKLISKMQGEERLRQD